MTHDDGVDQSASVAPGLAGAHAGRTCIPYVRAIMPIWSVVFMTIRETTTSVDIVQAPLSVLYPGDGARVHAVTGEGADGGTARVGGTEWMTRVAFQSTSRGPVSRGPSSRRPTSRVPF